MSSVVPNAEGGRAVSSVVPNAGGDGMSCVVPNDAEGGRACPVLYLMTKVGGHVQCCT